MWEDGAAVAVGGLGAGDVEMGGLRFTCSYSAGGERGDGAAEGQRMCATGLGRVGGQLEAGAADEGGGAEGGPETAVVSRVEGTGHMGVGCEGAGPAATGDTEGGGADEEREPGEGGGGVAEQRWGAEADGAGVWEDGAADSLSRRFKVFSFLVALACKFKKFQSGFYFDFHESQVQVPLSGV